MSLSLLQTFSPSIYLHLHSEPHSAAGEVVSVAWQSPTGMSKKVQYTVTYSQLGLFHNGGQLGSLAWNLPKTVKCWPTYQCTWWFRSLGTSALRVLKPHDWNHSDTYWLAFGYYTHNVWLEILVGRIFGRLLLIWQLAKPYHSYIHIKLVTSNRLERLAV